jgi:hypothetical protein
VLSLVSQTGVGAPSYNPRTSALAPELGRTFAAQRRAPTDETNTRLRDITVALVARLKDDGLPPERVIVALKAAIVRYGDEHRPPSLADEHESDGPGRAVYERVFQWALAAYFGTPAVMASQGAANDASADAACERRMRDSPRSLI